MVIPCWLPLLLLRWIVSESFISAIEISRIVAQKITLGLHAKFALQIKPMKNRKWKYHEHLNEFPFFHSSCSNFHISVIAAPLICILIRLKFDSFKHLIDFPFFNWKCPKKLPLNDFHRFSSCMESQTSISISK